MNTSRFLPASPALTLLLTLAACGGDGGSDPPPPPASISTLAYVISQCHEDARSLSASQRLVVRRGDGAPVTVAEIPTYGRLPALGLCPLFGALREGSASVYAFPFQRLGVSPDGSWVVFELNFEFSLLSPLGVRNPLTPEQEGIFVVGADGNNLRRLGPPSREPAERLSGLPSPSKPSVQAYTDVVIGFSPDGKSITFVDRGPGPTGEDAAQVVILDIASGARTPVTHLPATAPDFVHAAVGYPFFQDDETIVFLSRANPADPTGAESKGLNPEGTRHFFSVKTNGSQLTVLPPPVVLPGGFVPIPQITQSITSLDVVPLSLPGMPVNLAPFDLPDSPYSRIYELFVTAPDRTLQLTNFGRLDTGTHLVSSDGQRVFFDASADPLGSNPSENCQIFSIDGLGTDLRQLTHFGTAEHSAVGCRNGVLDQPGCATFAGPILDPHTQTVVFESTCDPFGTNPHGEQFFVMRPDGSGLRQLTSLRGVVTAADGSVDVELPGPIGYSAAFR